MKDFFSTNEMKAEDHNLYHVTSYENAQGKSMPDPNYENYLDAEGMVDRPPTKFLKGINHDVFIHPVKVRGKRMHNVWLVPAGGIEWAIVHHIKSQTMPRSRKFTLYVITPEYRRRHHIIQFSLPSSRSHWTHKVSPFIAPHAVSLPIKELRQITIDITNYPQFIALQKMVGNITPFMTQVECRTIFHSSYCNLLNTLTNKMKRFYTCNIAEPH